ncbi:double-stranded RNA-specific adenosine deaminase-like [Salmo salar]|uniref:Double-stranded RNA-specific adenosine deaminase-like n=1 Tax=Salmo salar TaxID=8030 RepID=A0A1S3QF11_SALSA|nr:double-stranded RNA-specific adenosine deaminase-like [Salmo salar]XP_014038581.2 double-stranded RNA-specific adenosine deaminase-like [Salmo salar]XP_014038582.2 double-stranded RNA-specific adenosine deaminase-like [Salmo salar]XP_014038583.2 double-stranded RNA-specific adenosine deaminase-like [Salmo salar]XP_045558210.1 double-stranded RNA-specific adenosine deaminase-like [Salmo salar]
MFCDNRQGDQLDLKERICTFLKVKKEGSTALQIAKAVGLKTAKDVNSVLYTLNRAGLLYATPDKPPVWSVSVQESDRVPSPSETPGITVEELRRVLMSKSDGRGMSAPQIARELGHSQKLVTMFCDNQQGDQLDLKERICTFLKVKKQGSTALQIAKAVGLKTAKDVNSILYTLNKAGLLYATPDIPPVWSVSVPESDRVPSPSETPGITVEELRRVLTSKSDGRGMSAPQISRELGQSRKLVTISCDNRQGDQLDLKERICTFLKVKKEGSTALQIAKAVGLKKAKDVNSVLYTLNRAGLLNATPDKPPVWSVEKPGAASVSVSVPESDRVPSPSETPGITVEELRRVLTSKSDGRGMSAQEIARELGKSRKCVNKHLYDLQSSGKAEKLGEKVWKMNDEASCGGKLIKYKRGLPDSEDYDPILLRRN